MHIPPQLRLCFAMLDRLDSYLYLHNYFREVKQLLPRDVVELREGMFISYEEYHGAIWDQLPVLCGNCRTVHGHCIGGKILARCPFCCPITNKQPLLQAKEVQYAAVSPSKSLLELELDMLAVILGWPDYIIKAMYLVNLTQENYDERH